MSQALVSDAHVMFERMKSDKFVIIVLFIAISVLSCSEIETTHNKDKEVVKNYFMDHLKTLRNIDNSKVKIKTDGLILNSNNLSEFILKHGAKFKNLPDKHSLMTFSLKEINDNGVVISYKSEVNHRSFAKNLKTIDLGDVFVRYFTKINCIPDLKVDWVHHPAVSHTPKLRSIYIILDDGINRLEVKPPDQFIYLDGFLKHYDLKPNKEYTFFIEYTNKYNKYINEGNTAKDTIVKIIDGNSIIFDIEAEEQ